MSTRYPVAAPVASYNVFVQRFSEQFHKEIDCVDNEATLQIIITLMNKCGLRELLDPPTLVQNRTTVSILNSSPHTSIAQNSSPGSRSVGYKSGDGLLSIDGPSAKKSTGYHIWQKERRQRWIAEGKIGRSPDYSGEWNLLSDSVKEDYKAYARNIRN